MVFIGEKVSCRLCWDEFPRLTASKLLPVSASIWSFPVSKSPPVWLQRQNHHLCDYNVKVATCQCLIVEFPHVKVTTRVTFQRQSHHLCDISTSVATCLTFQRQSHHPCDFSTSKSSSVWHFNVKVITCVTFQRESHRLCDLMRPVCDIVQLFLVVIATWNDPCQ